MQEIQMGILDETYRRGYNTYLLQVNVFSTKPPERAGGKSDWLVFTLTSHSPILKRIEGKVLSANKSGTDLLLVNNIGMSGWSYTRISVCRILNSGFLEHKLIAEANNSDVRVFNNNYVAYVKKNKRYIYDLNRQDATEIGSVSEEVVYAQNNFCLIIRNGIPTLRDILLEKNYRLVNIPGDTVDEYLASDFLFITTPYAAPQEKKRVCYVLRLNNGVLYWDKVLLANTSGEIKETQILDKNVEKCFLEVDDKTGDIDKLHVVSNSVITSRLLGDSDTQTLNDAKIQYQNWFGKPLTDVVFVSSRYVIHAEQKDEDEIRLWVHKINNPKPIAWVSAKKRHFALPPIVSDKGLVLRSETSAWYVLFFKYLEEPKETSEKKSRQFLF